MREPLRARLRRATTRARRTRRRVVAFRNGKVVSALPHGVITADDVVAVTGELQADGLSPWTVKRILGALRCVFTFALRRGYINAHLFDRLERDERPHPLRSDQRVLTQTELARL